MIASLSAAPDLAAGVAGLAAVALGCLVVGWRVLVRWPAIANVATLATLVATVGFAVTAMGRLELARLIPYSHAIVSANFVPVGGAALAGLLAGQLAIPRWRRGSVAALLLTLSWYPVARDVAAPMPEPRRPYFLEGISMQTTPASCSACAAVSILMHYRISAREREMMELCLTRYDGTPELGLYRGLVKKTASTPYRVQIFRTDIEGLQRFQDFPAILLVDAQETREPGSLPVWLRSTGDHAIVVYGITPDGKVDVGDPSSGRSFWKLDRLQRRWRGSGLYLVNEGTRPPTAAAASRVASGPQGAAKE